MSAAQALADIRLLWEYHRMHHALRPCSVAVGLGSHDLGVADVTAGLYGQRMAPLIVFTGANGPMTQDRMPRGEAVHYRERALALGVPASAVLLEPRAGNIGENIQFTKAVLKDADVDVSSVLLVTKPYEERRSYAMARKLWPEVEIVSASTSMEFWEYVQAVGAGSRLVVDMMVGALQRLLIFPEWGLAISQEVPDDAMRAYERLCRGGFTSQLLPVDMAPPPGRP